MLYSCLVAFAGLNAFTVPVKVVKLKLNKLDFRMFCENSVKNVRMIMEGKTDMPDQALRLFLLQPAETVEPFKHLEAV